VKPLSLVRFVALVRRARVLVVALKPGLGDGGYTTIATAHRLGVPVVVTDVLGTSDHFTDGLEARLVPPGEPGPLAEAIAGLCADPADGAHLAAAGRLREAQRCSVAEERLLEAVRAACDGLADLSQRGGTAPTG